MHSIQVMNRNFLIDQIRKAKYQHTLIIKILRSHKRGINLNERLKLWENVAYYRRVAKSCIREFRSNFDNRGIKE